MSAPWSYAEDDALVIAWECKLQIETPAAFDARFGTSIRRSAAAVKMRRGVFKLAQGNSGYIQDNYSTTRRNDARGSDKEYLARFARLAAKTPPPVEIDRPERQFRQLPPPALTAEAFS